MPASTFRAPGMRWPVPNLLTCAGILVLGLLGWMVFTALEEERALEMMFQADSDPIERVQSAELWSKQGAKAIPRLQDALASPDAKTRYMGLLALTYMPP